MYSEYFDKLPASERGPDYVDPEALMAKVASVKEECVRIERVVSDASSTIPSKVKAVMTQVAVKTKALLQLLPASSLNDNLGEVEDDRKLNAEIEDEETGDDDAQVEIALQRSMEELFSVAEEGNLEEDDRKPSAENENDAAAIQVALPAMSLNDNRGEVEDDRKPSAENDDDDAAMQMALQMSMNDMLEEVEDDRKPSAENDDDDAAMQMALQMSMNDMLEEFFSAAETGNLVVVQECINRGVNQEAKDSDGYNALHFAASLGHLEIVQYLIETCHVDTEANTNKGKTALHIASSNGHLEIVQYLIETCHVDTEAKDNDGWVALHLATVDGHLTIAQYLIETCQVDQAAKTNEGHTALHCAAFNGHLEIVQYLIETCQVDQAANQAAKTNEGHTALHCAAFNGHLEIVQYLLDICHVDKEAKGNDGMTALHIATSNGHLEIVQYLMETCRVDKEAKSKIGYTALHIATIFGHLEIVQYLIITCKVEKDAKDNVGQTALHIPSMLGQLEIVQYLIETCHVDKEAKSNNGSTALHIATTFGQLEIVQYLIKTCQVDKDAKDNVGYTPLHIAAARGHFEIVQCLIVTGLDDKEAKDDNGGTALHSASRSGSLEIVKFLNETCQVEIDAKDKHGFTALHYASMVGHFEIVQYLIETCHVDREAKNNSGSTALHVAAFDGHLEIVEYLIESCHFECNARNRNEETALHYASRSGHLAIVQYLIDTCHVEKDAKDKDGYTPLHHACKEGRAQSAKKPKSAFGWTLRYSDDDKECRLSVLTYLIETCHVDMNAKGNDGWVALHCASSSGFLEAVKYLIEQGTDCEATDYDGMTALHLAAEYGHFEIVKYFIEECKVDMWVCDNAGRTAYDISRDMGHDDITNYFHQRLDEERPDQFALLNINLERLALIPVNQPSVPLYTNGKVVLTQKSVDDVDDVSQSLSRLDISSGRSSLRGVNWDNLQLKNGIFSIFSDQASTSQRSGICSLLSVRMRESILGTSGSLNSANVESFLLLSNSPIPTHAVAEIKVDSFREQLQETRSCQSAGTSYATLLGSVKTDIISMSVTSDQTISIGSISLLWKSDTTSNQTTSSVSVSGVLKSDRTSVNRTSNQSTSSGSINDLLNLDIVSVHSHSGENLILAINPKRADYFNQHMKLSDSSRLLHPTDTRTNNSEAERNVTPTRNSSNELPNIHSFPDVYTIDELPWYAVVIGSQDSKTSGLKESLTYRDIRNHSKYIPLEVFYYKLLQTYQQPEHIKKHQEKIPTHEDQLLFVYVDNGVFRPIHWKAISEPANSLSPRGKTDFLVAADIKSNGGRIRLSSDEKKEQVEILIQLKRRDLDSIVPELPYRQIVSRTLAAIEGVIAEVAGDEDFTKHNAQIRETWELYFPSPEQNRKRKFVPFAIVGNLVTPANQSNELPNIHNFQDEYTKHDLPWYAVVIGSNVKQYCQLGASLTYRSIRDRSKFIPVEILLYKLLQIFQQPEYIKKHKIVPTHEDQLLFVYVDKGIFRPIHRTEGMDNTLSPRQKRDSLVAADIKKNGGKHKLSELSVEDKKDHLGILIRIMRRALDSMEVNISYRQIVSTTLDTIEEFISGRVDDADIAKHEIQIKNTWERYFPTVPMSDNKKPKLAVSNNDKDE